MYKNSHDLWDGDTVNKSGNSAEIFLGTDSSKVKSSGGNNLSHDTNNVAEDEYFGKKQNTNSSRRGYNIFKKLYTSGRHKLDQVVSSVDKKIDKITEVDRVAPDSMYIWEEEHDKHNEIMRGQLDIIRSKAKYAVKAYEALMDAKLLREALVPFKSLNHAAAAYDIGRGINGSNNLASTAQRFASQYDSLYKRRKYVADKIEQGANAIRHTFWQGALSSKYGPKVARDVGDSHETRPYADANIRIFDNKEDADMVTDLLNNKIGRRVGAQYPDIDRQELAFRVLEEYWKRGLYSYEQMPDGKWYVTKKVIPDDVYYDLYEKYRSLNKYGR